MLYERLRADVDADVWAVTPDGIDRVFRDDGMAAPSSSERTRDS
jgi:hypothetical protein